MSLSRMLPSGSYELPGLDEFEVTFHDYTKPTKVDIGDCNLAQLLNYLACGDKDPPLTVSAVWPKYEFDHQNDVFKIHMDKPNIVFNMTEGAPYIVEFVGP